MIDMGMNPDEVMFAGGGDDEIAALERELMGGTCCVSLINL